MANQATGSRGPAAGVFIGLLAGVASCQNGLPPGSYGGPSGPPPATGSDFAAAAGQALCANLGPCCAQAHFGFNEANCATAEQGIVQGFLVNPAIAAGATYHPENAAACLDFIRGEVVDCLPSKSLNSGANPCGSLYSGTKPAGAVCTSNLDCAAPAGTRAVCAYGDDAQGKQIRQCQVLVPPKAGDKCTGIFATGIPPTMSADCGAGSAYPFTCSGGVCVALAGIGGHCVTDSDCVSTARCSSGACAARLGSGVGCATDPLACASGLACYGTPLICQALKAGGVACAADRECAAGLCSSGMCKYFVDGSVCGAPPL